MRKMILMSAVICLFFFTTIGLTGCNKIFNASGHYNLSGILMDSCGGQRIANRPLVILYKDMSYPNPVSNKVVGRGSTDASGYFDIKCEKINQGELTMVDTLTGERYIRGMQAKNQSDFNYYLGFVYTIESFYKSSVKLYLTGKFLVGDTLFVGKTSTNYKFYYPVESGMYINDEFKFNFPGGGYSASQKQIKNNISWGIGKRNFDTSIREVFMFSNICDYPDTTTIVTINNP